jgi:hypothetical protein
MAVPVLLYGSEELAVKKDRNQMAQINFLQAFTGCTQCTI